MTPTPPAPMSDHPAAPPSPSTLSLTELEARIDELVKNENVEDAANELDGIARTLLSTCQSLATRNAELEREREALERGPYEAKPCRGHWHVYNDGHELSFGALDEQGAREQAAKCNAEWNTSKDKLEFELATARARVLGLEQDAKRLEGTLDAIATALELIEGEASLPYGDHPMTRRIHKVLNDAHLAAERYLDAAAAMQSPPSPKGGE